ncbi:MAG: hypothetical protein HW421_2302 [Ignavibacteria bacterium]|nr:hypothetical protein [Ignavibacteria bacterium]
MEPSKEFCNFFKKYNSLDELIENLIFTSLIESYKRVRLIKDIDILDEPLIKDKFQYDLTWNNVLTKELIKKNFITFNWENQILTKDSEKKRTDLCFIINSLIVFVIECKKISGAITEQYIENGINRFTQKIYITDEKFAGMCSFVVKSSIIQIIPKIKKLLMKNNCSGIGDRKIDYWDAYFYSTHKKIDGSDLGIYHIFFDFNN